MKMLVRFQAPLSGLRIWHCCEPQCRSQTLAVAMALAGSRSSNSTSSLETYKCCRCSSKKMTKKNLKKKTSLFKEFFPSVYLSPQHTHTQAHTHTHTPPHPPTPTHPPLFSSLACARKMEAFPWVAVIEKERWCPMSLASRTPRFSLGNIINDLVPCVKVGTQSAGIWLNSQQLPIQTHSWRNSSDIKFLLPLFWQIGQPTLQELYRGYLALSLLDKAQELFPKT